MSQSAEQQLQQQRVESAQAAMSSTVDALGRAVQRRVFADQVNRFCSIELEDLKNPDKVCVDLERQFDECVLYNVRVVSDFRYFARAHQPGAGSGVDAQEKCIGGIGGPDAACADAMAQLVDCIGAGHTRRTKATLTNKILADLREKL
ncbi:hypothetical protein HDU82_004620 [Entophlyctis luteolus]|nr:hypothetical protein HDU82_004620 [Entophlyctis luteolus]